VFGPAEIDRALPQVRPLVDFDRTVVPIDFHDRASRDQVGHRIVLCADPGIAQGNWPLPVCVWLRKPGRFGSADRHRSGLTGIERNVERHEEWRTPAIHAPANRIEFPGAGFYILGTGAIQTQDQLQRNTKTDGQTEHFAYGGHRMPVFNIVQRSVADAEIGAVSLALDRFTDPLDVRRAEMALLAQSPDFVSGRSINFAAAHAFLR